MKKERGRFRRDTTAASIGINLVAATFIGLGIGLYLDKLFSTAPWLMIIFLILGIAAGFKNLFAQAKKFGLLDDEEEDGNGDGE